MGNTGRSIVTICVFSLNLYLETDVLTLLSVSIFANRCTEMLIDLQGRQNPFDIGQTN